MKGDYADVTYRLPQNAATTRVQATRDGSTVEVKMPDRGDLFVRVTELNKAQNPIRTFRFRADEVLSIAEGHQPIVRVKKK